MEKEKGEKETDNGGGLQLVHSSNASRGTLCDARTC